jgi:hypothetical protein
MACLTIQSHEQFAEKIQEALGELKDEPEIRKKLELLKLQFETGELPAREERTFDLSGQITRDWPKENKLGFVICELEYYYCRHL